MSKIKVVFWGTPYLSVAIAESILDWADIIAVVTTPDTPQGRKKVLTPSPLKIFAQDQNIPFFNPEKLSTPYTIKLLQGLKADIWLVVAYGKIIPQNILDIMPNKVLNIHPSLLPKYRGPSPIQASLKNGDSKTAVTLMELDHLMDHGPIIAQQDINILPTDTYIQLEQKIIKTSATLLAKNIPLFIEDKIYPKPQDDSLATTVSMVQKSDGQINWNIHTAQDIINLYRAYIIWPKIYTSLNTNKKIIFEEMDLQVKESNLNLKPGYWQLNSEENKIIVGTKEGNISVSKLKIEGKNIIDAKSFANGYKNTYFTD